MQNIKVLTSEYRIYFPKVQDSKFFSFVNYFLRLYFDTNSLSKDLYNWLPPEDLLIGPEPGEGTTAEFLDDLCHRLEQDKVDILGVSVYVWNKVYFKTVCREIKKRLPHIIIIAGGPELDAHKDVDFFKKNPWYDYVIYGDGEKAFTDLLDHLAGKQVELTNVVSSDGTVYPHAVFNDKNTLKKSPYLTYKDEIKEVITKFRKDSYARFKRYPSIIGVWETTKGCPYSCSFCDWSSGLHNKVRFWGIKTENLAPTERPVYELELEFFADLKFHMVQWSNPNVGLSPQDVEIVDYWCKLKETHPTCPKSFILQLSKVKKDVSHELYKKMIRAGLENKLKFDVQDLDPVVIANLDRPEIPWSEHKVMIKEFIDEFPETAGHFKSKINYIWGLPGQTLAHYDYNLIETTELGFQTHYFYYEMLPNSPASDPAYIEKFGINIEKVYVAHLQIPSSIKELTPDVLLNYFTEANLITSTNSMSKRDWYTGIVKNYIYKYYFFGVMNKKVDKFLANFYRYQSLVDDMYEHFLQHNIISVHSIHLMNSGLYDSFRERMQQITDEIYSEPVVLEKNISLLPASQESLIPWNV